MRRSRTRSLLGVAVLLVFIRCFASATVVHAQIFCTSDFTIGDCFGSATKLEFRVTEFRVKGPGLEDVVLVNNPVGDKFDVGTNAADPNQVVGTWVDGVDFPLGTYDTFELKVKKQFTFSGSATVISAAPPATQTCSAVDATGNIPKPPTPPTGISFDDTSEPGILIVSVNLAEADGLATLDVTPDAPKVDITVKVNNSGSLRHTFTGVGCGGTKLGSASILMDYTTSAP